MRIDRNPVYARRVWAGDQKTVSEACAAFEADPKEGLLPYAIALYSFRNKRRYAEELIGLRYQLLNLVKGVLERKQDSSWTEEMYRKEADLADVLSTHLEWMSRQEGFDVEELPLRKWAHRLCDRGSFYAGMHFGNGGSQHSWCLIKLTKARLLLEDKRLHEGEGELSSVKKEMQRIEDPNQRARVYRKLGFLLRMNWRLPSGFYWGVRACLVPGTPLMVRLKSVAALFGIDR